MSDPYIDQTETTGYGDFAGAQMEAMLLDVDEELGASVTVMIGRLAERTAAMNDVLQASTPQSVTYAGAASAGDDPVAEARDVLRRLASFATSRKGGAAIQRDLLNNESLTTVTRRRPAKLEAALTHAEKRLDAHAAAIGGEITSWKTELSSAKTALTSLNAGVRKARAEKAEMTPAVAKAREAWLVTYTACKHLARSILSQAGKLDLMPEIFDDLAEVHRVSGVSDDPPPAAPPAAPPPADPPAI